MLDINKRIIALCKERHWSLYELARRADVPHSTINSCIERDNAPKLENLQRICDSFGITLAQFFSIDEQVHLLTETEQTLIELFRTLPPEQQSAVLTFLKK